MAREPARGEHAVEVGDDRGRVSTARLRLRFCRMTVLPPVAKQGRYASLKPAYEEYITDSCAKD
jgi:hypothetical protein